MLGAGLRTVVVGAGIVGLSAAYHLRKRGHEVVVVEKDSETGEGCSYGNGGVLVPSHYLPLAAPGMIGMGLRYMRRKSSPFGFAMPPSLETLAWMGQFARAASEAKAKAASPLICDLNRDGIAEYESLLRDIGCESMPERNGLLVVCNREDTLEHERAGIERARELGLEVTDLSRNELQEAAGADVMASGALRFNDDAHVHPPTVMKALESWLANNGVQFRRGTPIKNWIADGDRVTTALTGKEAIVGDQFVLAAGAWSGQLARSLSLKLPMLAGQGYGFTVPSPPQTVRMPMILVESRVAVTPMPDGVRFVGTMELGSTSMRPNPFRIAGMLDAIGESLPRFRTGVLEGPVWAGMRPCTPDGLPYIGRPAKFANLIVAAGHAMIGMSLGPITGRLVGQIADGEPTSCAIELLNPDRYA